METLQSKTAAGDKSSYDPDKHDAVDGTCQDFRTLLDQEYNWSDKKTRKTTFTEEANTAAQSGRGLWENNSKRVKEQLDGLLKQLEDQYCSSRNQLAHRTLLVCFPDPTVKHASLYIVPLYIIPVLMVLYSFVVLQKLLYSITSMSNTAFSRRFLQAGRTT